MAYTSWSVVFGEQPSAAKWNILGTNDAHFYSFLGDNTAWQTWTPTWANFTVGNGVNSSAYSQIGKTVNFRLVFVLGTTSSMGTAPTFTLPVTSVAVPNTNCVIGNGQINNTGGAYNAFAKWVTTTTGKLFVWDTNNNESGVTAVNPGAWGTNWVIVIRGQYEAA